MWFPYKNAAATIKVRHDNITWSTTTMRPSCENFGTSWTIFRHKTFLATLDKFFTFIKNSCGRIKGTKSEKTNFSNYLPILGSNIFYVQKIGYYSKSNNIQQFICCQFHWHPNAVIFVIYSLMTYWDCQIIEDVTHRNEWIQ